MKDLETDTVTEHASGYRDNRLTLGGVLALCLLATTQLLSREKLPASACFAVGCFAIAVPLLAVNISLLSLELDYRKSSRPWYIWCSTGIGVVTGLLGAAATFFVLHVWAGILFIVASVVAATVMYDFIDRIQKLNPEQFEESESEQGLGGDSENRAEDGPVPGAHQC